MSDSSYRSSLRTTSLMGGAQLIVLVARLLKVKLVAVWLGPAGVGLLGLYGSLLDTATSIAGLGMGSAAVRQIAAANSDEDQAATGRTLQALLWGTLFLGISGGAVFWLASGLIARVVIGDESRAGDVAWLSLGIALSVAAGSQGAVLTGLRRVGDLARLNVWCGLLSALIGVLALRLFPSQGVILMILAGPVVSFSVGVLYVSRLVPGIGSGSGRRAKFSEVSSELGDMTKLGLAFMASGLVVTLGQLVVRTLIQRQEGPEALGQFQAAWSIGITYLGYVFAAMITDYYPRLTASINDHSAAGRLINEQTEIGILICGPIIVGLLALAPWVVALLYAPAFAPAVEILRWQLLGDIFKVLAWPIGFTQQATGAVKSFFVTETLATGVFVVGVYLLLPRIGVTATGVAFLFQYLFYAPVAWWLARQRVGFHWRRSVSIQAVTVLIVAAAVSAVGGWSNMLGALFGGICAAALALWSLVRLSSVTSAGGRFRRLAAAGDRITGWISRKW